MLTTKLIRSGLIVALAASAPAVAPAQEKLGIRYGNETIYEESLPAPLRQQLFALETELNKRREQLLDQFVVKRYLAERAEIEGRTVTELEAELLSVEAPDEVTVRHTYDNNWQQIPGEYEQVRDELALNIQEQLRSRKLDDLLAQIRASKDYEVILPDSDQPVYPVTTEGYPFKGPADAKVTVALFAHFQCPPCNAAISLIDRLPEELIGQVKLVYRYFPIDSSGKSWTISEGGVCADQQGRFWDYHDLVSERQDRLTVETPSKLAVELGLDTATFMTCLEDGQARAKVTESTAEGLRLGLSDTPAVLVDGQLIHGHGDLEWSLTAAVRRALAEKS